VEVNIVKAAVIPVVTCAIVPIVLLLVCLVPSRIASAAVQFYVDATQPGHKISPYIYGCNFHTLGPEENVASQRYGGNRLTGYNWETNASNAGSDWHHSSDGYLSSSVEPGKALMDFHEKSLEMGVSYTIVTLQAAGYVAADRRGTVREDETAPSPRWKQVKFRKGAPFSLVPDRYDDYVYMDECVNFLVSKYGDASTPTGVKAYSIDNEPALWPHTHPRIHPQKTTCREIIEKTVELASAIKDVDPHAEVFGPALYGYGAFDTFQDAPDWDKVRLGKGYSWFIDYYLDEMRKASESAGRRLLDVLDLHWYPEARGDSRIVFEQDPTSEKNIAARLQAPRSLWDLEYVEDSWISRWRSPSREIPGVGTTREGAIALLPRVLASIEKYYPGTKLAITEFSYGAEDHISGGIAMADALGIFGKYGLYAANYWQTSKDIDYVAAAYRIYRNYDGRKSTFGDISLKASTSDVALTSVYASMAEPAGYSGSGLHTPRLHIIAINKASEPLVDAFFAIVTDRAISDIEVWAFDENSPEIKTLAPPTALEGTAFKYTLPALSVCHFVISLK